MKLSQLGLSVLLIFVFGLTNGHGQSIAVPWSGHGHDPQHTAISPTHAQPLGQIRWQMPVDLDRQYWGSSLLVHYGSPLITRQNTALVPVKVGGGDTFRVEARNPADGAVKWMAQSDYSLPPHGWTPPFGIALTPKNRLYYPGAGGTVYFRDSPDAASGATGQLAFYGAPQYQADPATFDDNVKISTPITADRYGTIYFGFQVLGSNPANLQSGLARIAEDGVATWIFAGEAASDGGIQQVVLNCAPALSNDGKKLYVAVTFGSYSGGYMLMLDSRTLATQAKIRLTDPLYPDSDAKLADDGSAAPTIGPDGDVYYGVLEAAPYSNHFRGWLLHFDGALTQRKIAGSFGWDDTASIVPASLVPSYTGSSEYLILTKYNDYVSAGGSGVNRLALVDPNASMISSINGATVMNEVLAIACPTPDWEYPNVPGAVREWCINTAAIDPATKSALAGAEDGKLYRWSFETNSFSEVLTLTNGVGEAYTPTMVGVDGTVYAIADGTL
ncbi:MAG: hypothetical protein M3032_01155, partial [Verrucomicrobiota bacterium]|nr:hypothetical protein [Verrucomicrobiota bacterium]